MDYEEADRNALRKYTTTDAVLAEVKAHRTEQVARYGTNDDLEDGTGPGVPWLVPLSFSSARHAEQLFRGEYNSHDHPTWMHLIREEVAEAFMESDPARLREELIQVAALCVSWVETLDTR